MDERVKQILRIAREHYDRREFDKAEPLLRSILDQTERFADVRNMLGVIAHERRDYKEAEACFAKALEINPNYTEAALNLAVTYNDLGKYDLARQVHERATAGKTPQDDGLDPFVKGKIANMHAEVGQAYIDANLIRDAVPEFEKAVSLCPTFADLRWRLGMLYKDLGDMSRARVQFEAAKLANPKFANARVALAVVMIAAGEKKAAETELQDVLAFDAEHKTAQMYLRMLKGLRPPSTSRPPPSRPPSA
ncbi:MAG: tetratricopeptide repeat protein [Polyangiales bacterium]